MKKLFSITLMLILAVSLFMLPSCAKKKGCMDANSVNFVSDAEEDDGSCKYQGKVIFWYGKDFADSCVAYGVNTIVIKVDGVIAGSSAASVYWVTAPSCSASGTISYTKDLGSNKTGNVSATLELGTGIGKETITIPVTLNSANSCLLQEFQW